MGQSRSVRGRRLPGAGANGPTRTPDFRRVVWGRARPYVYCPSVAETSFCEETAIMADRIRRTWTFVLAVAPIAAIALVEAAMRRW